MADKIFTDGLIFKRPRAGAPDFVKANISIKVEEFVAFLQKHKKQDGWVNIDVLTSRENKLYCALNQFQKDIPENVLTPEQTKSVQEARGAAVQAQNSQDFQLKNDINPEDIPF